VSRDLAVSSSTKWLKASLLIQILLAAYFQVILWFPLGSGFGRLVIGNIRCQLPDEEFLKEIDGGRFANPE
jgi:hypothetical protein